MASTSEDANDEGSNMEEEKLPSAFEEERKVLLQKYVHFAPQILIAVLSLILSQTLISVTRNSSVRLLTFILWLPYRL